MAVRGIIMHTTDGPTWAEAHAWLNRDPSDNPASYHYGISATVTSRA